MATTTLIKSLYYASPYASPPPGVTVTGITVQTDPAQSPAGKILVIRLRMASNDSIVLGVSNTSGAGTSNTAAVLQPPFPLSATESYMIDLIWVTSGTPPVNIDWNAAVMSAPVTATEVSIKGSVFDGTNMTTELSYGDSSAGVGAQVNVYSLSNGTYVLLGSAQTQSNFTTQVVNLQGMPPVFFLSAQAVIPVNNLTAGGFAAPFSRGPQSLISPLSGVPVPAAALTTAVYDGNTLSLNWTLTTGLTGAVAPVSSRIQIMSGTQVIATFQGGPTSAIVPLDLLNQTNGLTVSIATMCNNISSAPISFGLITQSPTVKSIALQTGANPPITATVANIPAGVNASGYLMNGSTVLAGPIAAVAGTITFPTNPAYNPVGMVGLTVAASYISTDGKVTGPLGAPSVVLATAPTLTQATIYTDPATPANWRIDASWSRLPDHASAIASYTLNVLQTGTTIPSQTTSGTSVTLSIPKTSIDITKTQTLQLWATSITGGASPLQASTALFVPPLLSALTTTGLQINAVWAPPVIPNVTTLKLSYRLAVSAAGNTLYTGPLLNATQGSVPLADSAIPATGALVMVNASIGVVTLITDASMPAGSRATPLLTAPTLNTVTTNPLTNISTLNWAAIAGSTYTIQFTNGAAPATATTNSYPLSGALAPGASVGYSVMSAITTNGVVISSPYSRTMYVPTNAAIIKSTRFDGSQATVTWEKIDPALSYYVSVYDNTGAQAYTPHIFNDTKATFNLTTVSSKTYTAYVQPVMEMGVGLSGPGKNIFNQAWFVSQQPAATAYPYTYIAPTMAALGTATALPPVGQDIVMYLPELGLAAGALGTTAITQDPFKIEPSGQTNLPYKLTIMGDAAAWGFTTAAIRATLQSTYVTFLRTLESPGGSLAGATPYGISLVQAAIAGALPQTFAELLYYNYGYSTSTTVGAGYIDLRPGMILRVSSSDYVNISQNGVPSYINGYSSAGFMDYEIGAYANGNGSWRVGFDGFLNTLVSAGTITLEAPANSTGNVQAGIGNSLDLYYQQFIQPFYRLYFPSTIPSSWSVGSNTTNTNFTLVAAAKYSDLQNTTVTPSVTNATAYFRGRTMVEVMIKIVVNGFERLVPVGTSVGNVLQQLGMAPTASSPLLSQIRLLRSVAAVNTSTTPTAAANPQLEVNLSWNGLQSYSTGNGLNALSMPLLPGDQLLTSS